MTEAIAIKEDKIKLTEADVKEYIAPNATKKELYMFLNIANSYNLNPFKREVHFVKYGTSPGQTIVGYETYIKRAEATGQLDGWKCWIDGDQAKIIIYRKDMEHPFEWEVDRNEFDKRQSTWKIMGNFMLKKVCISQGFRLCFPEQLGGMPYIPEEIGVNNKIVEPKEPEPKEEPTQEPKEPTDKAEAISYMTEIFGKLKEEHQKDIIKIYGADFAILSKDDLRQAYKIAARTIKGYENNP